MPTVRSKWGPVHVGQGAISAIELVEDAVAIRANPEPVEPSDSQRCVIQQRKSSCLIINPEFQVLVSCRRVDSANPRRRLYGGMAAPDRVAEGLSGASGPVPKKVNPARSGARLIAIRRNSDSRGSGGSGTVQLTIGH